MRRATNPQMVSEWRSCYPMSETGSATVLQSAAAQNQSVINHCLSQPCINHCLRQLSFVLPPGLSSSFPQPPSPSFCFSLLFLCSLSISSIPSLSALPSLSLPLINAPERCVQLLDVHAERQHAGEHLSARRAQWREHKVESDQSTLSQRLLQPPHSSSNAEDTHTRTVGTNSCRSECDSWKFAESDHVAGQVAESDCIDASCC